MKYYHIVHNNAYELWLNGRVISTHATFMDAYRAIPTDGWSMCYTTHDA